MRKYLVEFMSPGTFINESTSMDIDDHDTKKAVEMAKAITERYNAKPFGFRFITILTAMPVDDGEGGKLEVTPREVYRSGVFYLTGTVRSYDDIKKKADPKEDILRSNMRCNGWPYVIENNNPWRFTGRYEEGDCIVDWSGKVIDKGNSEERMDYRKSALHAMQEEPVKRKVEPLQKHTMTLDELQRRTVKVIRQMQKQLKRKHFHGGMTDEEFSDQVLNTCANDIYCDRIILGYDRRKHG